ncbi:MAG: Uma2 family endonuclease [Deltaproteobacteria bacterium]|nr:Uma2 family endonuclease [Deltaproteobacteria bacterium]
MGEEISQRWILRPLLPRWLTERGIVALVGADQFIYYQQFDPHQRFAPDIYVLPGVPPETRVRAWKTWETGIVPSFALEIASDEWEKDYVEAPRRCAAARIGELVVFDPSWGERPGGVGVRWQLFRQPERGGLRRIEATNEPAIRSRVLGCWLRVVGAGSATRIRIGVGPRGASLVATSEEAERAARQAERAAKQAQEAERAAKERALARVSELEAKLAGLTSGGKARGSGGR